METPRKKIRMITPIKITDQSPVFPCWMWQQMKTPLHSSWIHWDDDEWHKDNASVSPEHLGYTHWHPDQPTEPTQPPAEDDPGIDVVDPQGGVQTVSARHPSLTPPAPLVGGTAHDPSTATRDIAGWAKVLADEIYAAMKGRGLTQSDLADKMGVSRQYISRVLAAGENFSLETLAKFANALDLKLRVKLSRIESQNCPECGGVLPWCALRDRIRNYFGNGGLFNPEHMEHQKVRNLLMDVADAIDTGTPSAPAEVAAGYSQEGRPVSPASLGGDDNDRGKPHVEPPALPSDPAARATGVREAVAAAINDGIAAGEITASYDASAFSPEFISRILRALTPLLDRREGEHEKREEDLMQAWSADLTEHERNEAALRTLVAKQREALQMLLDNQNGCPLHTWQKEWDEAIRLTGIALVLTPEGIADELAAKDAELARLTREKTALSADMDGLDKRAGELVLRLANAKAEAAEVFESALREAEAARGEAEKFKRRLEWLHAPGGDHDAYNREWGVFIVTWSGDGQVVAVEQTLSDFSDLDAEMAKDAARALEEKP